MAINRGNPTGPTYGLGTITVATAGTPVALTANSVTTGSFGTAASPSPIVAQQIRIFAPTSNNGNIYLVHKGGTAASTENIAMVIAPGTTEILSSPQLSNPFSLQAYQLDADASGNQGIISLVIV